MPEPAADFPVQGAEFASLMAPLGPWPAARRIAVAVSGGADSLSLALLTSGWGNPIALVVDHGLRNESASEAELTATRLAKIGIRAIILRLNTLHRGPALAARARAARYRALTQAALSAGCLDLLLGHHRGDQAETLDMRRLSRSGTAGLAGMASIVESHDVRLVRPLLTIPRARLRATLLHAGLDWVEDPSNQDQSALRARLRRALADDTGAGPAVAARTAEAKAFAVSRAATERDTASILAQRVQIFPSGHALLSPGPIAPAALAALIRTVSGGPYPPGTQALARLAANPVPCVIAGVRFLDAGRLGPGLLIVREEAAIEPPIDAIPGILWDRRFYLAASAGGLQGITIGALGADAPRLRGASPLPSAVLITLPALRQNGTLAAVPHIGYPVVGTPARPAFFFSPALPLSGAPFCV